MSDRPRNGSVWEQAERASYAAERSASALESIAASLALIVPILQAREERDPLRLMDEVIRAAKDEQESGMPETFEPIEGDGYERIRAPRSEPIEELGDLGSIIDSLPPDMRAQFLAAKEEPR